MARLTDEDFAALRVEQARAAARPLAAVRRAAAEQRDGATDAWLEAGDRFAERAIAALDLGDDERAATLIDRILALPVVDGTRSGTAAVGVLLAGELIDPLADDAEAGLLDLPLRLLPGLEPRVADELRRALGALLDYDLPQALARRIRAVSDEVHRLEPPFAGVPETELPAAVTGVLRLVLRLRSAG